MSKNKIQDYVVVKTHEEARELLTRYRGKDLAHKWVIVAPKGIEFVSLDDLIELPQVKNHIREEIQAAEKRTADEILIKFIIEGSALTMFQTEKSILWTAEELRKSMIKITAEYQEGEKELVDLRGSIKKA